MLTFSKRFGRETKKEKNQDRWNLKDALMNASEISTNNGILPLRHAGAQFA
jgi:hypothetical protein